MQFIMEQGFDLEEGQTREFQSWLESNEAELAKSCPTGVEYLGTFTAIYTSEKQAGTMRTYWRMDSYAAQDRFAAAMKEEGNRFGELLNEAVSFSDQRNDANWSNGLFKALVDASIIGE
ncbi:MAG: hypothetical protein R3320_12615 [Nitriliruptorales bacterium]|nr:hypothetical protein [Nitriliruptorales bacterium]